MLKSFGVLCGGDYGGVVAAREILVAVRRLIGVLLVQVGTEVGLTTCVWSRIALAKHSTPVSRGAGVQSGPLQRCR